MRIAGVIIAGGRSSRMGGHEKSFLPLNGEPLIARVIARIAPQVDLLAINANGDPARFADFGLPVFPDRLPLGTPLAGVEAALHWAAEAGADWLLTVPSDAPDLPSDLVEKLAGSTPAYASSSGRQHYLTALWPVGLHRLLRNAVTAEGLRAVRDFASLAGARAIEWQAEERDPFTNLNSPEDVAAFLEARNHERP
jgi:molybdopterin-guanine dinucleotide biosynthesis protein A